MSRLEHGGDSSVIPLVEHFPDEYLFHVDIETPWFADFVNYWASNCTFIPDHYNAHARKKFLRDARSYIWDDPYLWKVGKDQVIRRCIPQGEAPEIISLCHSSLCE